MEGKKLDFHTTVVLKLHVSQAPRAPPSLAGSDLLGLGRAGQTAVLTSPGRLMLATWDPHLGPPEPYGPPVLREKSPVLKEINAVLNIPDY